MSLAADFLVSLARSASNLALYPSGHPVRERSIAETFERMQAFQEETPQARFTFLEGLTVLGRRPVRSLMRWDWGERLQEWGIQWLELDGPVPIEELTAFLEEVLRRQSGRAAVAEAPAPPSGHLRYGALGIRSDEEGEGSDGVAIRAFSLAEELDAVAWLHEEVARGGEVHLVEAEAVVRSLATAMRGDGDELIPLLRLDRPEPYTTTHAMNTAVLAMTLAEHVGCLAEEVRAIGIAALLHDLGMVFLPEGIAHKEGSLTPAEWERVREHPAEGARRLLSARGNTELAAVVAFEHHMEAERGYPTPSRPRHPHPASRLVRVCDVFDALWSPRPYRDAWEIERILEYLERGAGRHFDADLTLSFTRMMRRREERIVVVTSRDDPLLVTGIRPD